MANIIPNEETWIGFLPAGANEFGVADFDAPTGAEIAAAIDLTDFVIMLNPSTTGNTVPTPRLKSLFEPSIAGTATGTLSGQFYRDDAVDTAYETLPRGAKGAFIISRFGGTGPNKAPAAGDACEVWPCQVSSEAADSMQSNTAQTFTLTAAVPVEPGEHIVAVA
jgi:hypothetical protein